MEIRHIGRQAFLIKGKKESVLVNPDQEILAKSNSRIVVYNKSTDVELRAAGEKISIMGPGEYEVGGVEVYGFSAGTGNTMYTIVMDGVVVGVTGRLDEDLNDKKVEKIGGVDVLMADIGGQGIGSKVVIGLAKKLGANLVVPVEDSHNDGIGLKKFLDETDAEGMEPVDFLKVEKESLPDGMEVVILKANK